MSWDKIEQIIYNYLIDSGKSLDSFFDINNCDLDRYYQLLNELYEEIYNITH